MEFYRKSSDVSADMEEMKLEGKVVDPNAATTTTVRQLFTDPDLRRPLFIACALAVIQQFSGINAVRHHIQYAVFLLLSLPLGGEFPSLPSVPSLLSPSLPLHFAPPFIAS